MTYFVNGIHKGIEEIREIHKSNNSENRAIAEAILDWHQNEQFQFQTSGSTGTPKNIEFSKDQIIASVSQSQSAFELETKDVALLSLPMKYVAGKMMLYRALHIGMNVITIEPKMTITKDKFDSRVTFAAFIPSQIQSLIDTREGRTWLESIRVVLVGGASITSKLENELKSYSNMIYHTYGMTETLTHIAIRKLSQGGSAFFRPLPHVDLSVNADDKLTINAEHLGVLLDTNDVVELRHDFSFKIKGRTDNVINSGGLKIQCEELEAVFKKYIQHELIIIGKPDEQLQEKVVLIIESDAVMDPEWMMAAQSELPKNKWPKEIKYVTELPRTNSGKVKRSAIVL